LKRLLELNLKIHDEEVKAGLWNKKSTKAKEDITKVSESTLVNEKKRGLGGV
jgi:hypothetical protein